MKKVLFLLVLFVIPIWWGLWYVYQQALQKELEQTISNVEIAYKNAESSFQIPAQIFLETVVLKDPILRICKEAMDADDQRLAELNKALFELLAADYERLVERNILQLHFHLPDNRSFVRFHRPSRFGDDLTVIRPTVSKVNREHQPTFGFEVGRFFSGFREVMPLIYQDQHIGSVEVSFSYQAIIELMQLTTNLDFEFLLTKDVIEEKIFADQIEHFTPSASIPSLYYEMLDKNEQKIITEEERSTDLTTLHEIAFQEQDFKQQILANKTAATIFYHQGQPYQAVAYSVKNFENAPVAYFIGYASVDWLESIHTTYQLFFVLITTLFVALVGIVYLLNSNQKRSQDFIANLSKKNTRLTESSLALEQRNRDLIKAKHTTAKFLSIISHDLKNPSSALAAASGLLDELIREQVANQDIKKLSDTIRKTSQRNLSLLKDLLDWSRSQGGTLSFKPEPLNVANLLYDEIHLVESLFAQKHIALTTDLSPALTVHGDRSMLGTVIRNLLMNAVKFTQSHGQVKLSSWQEQNMIFIAVKDSGVGIPKEKIPTLFQVIAESSEGTEGEKGTGLGLVLCKEFLEYHKGQITVKSQLGQGSTFIIELPKYGGASRDL